MTTLSRDLPNPIAADRRDYMRNYHAEYDHIRRSRKRSAARLDASLPGVMVCPPDVAVPYRISVAEWNATQHLYPAETTWKVIEIVAEAVEDVRGEERLF